MIATLFVVMGNGWNPVMLIVATAAANANTKKWLIQRRVVSVEDRAGLAL